MDISFYVLLVVACLVLLLAMWACAASNTPKWGPDLTLELPPHLLQEVLFGHLEAKKSDPIGIKNNTVPSAPSELPCDPLLSNEHPVDVSNPLPKFSRKPVFINMENAVRVLPTNFAHNHRLKPVFCTFATEEPA